MTVVPIRLTATPSTPSPSGGPSPAEELDAAQAISRPLLDPATVVPIRPATNLNSGPSLGGDGTIIPLRPATNHRTELSGDEPPMTMEAVRAVYDYVEPGLKAFTSTSSDRVLRMQKRMLRREWIEFPKLAKLAAGRVARENGKLRPDAQQLVAAYELLHQSMKDGDFEEDGRLRVACLDALSCVAFSRSPTLRVTREHYERVPENPSSPNRHPMQDYLESLCIPRRMACRWLEDLDIPIPSKLRDDQPAQGVRVDQAAPAVEVEPAPPAEEPRGKKMRETIARMRDDISSGRMTPQGLHDLLQKSLAARYGVSRHVAVPARAAVMSEMSRTKRTKDK